MNFDTQLELDLLDFVKTLANEPLSPLSEAARKQLLTRMQAGFAKYYAYVDLESQTKRGDDDPDDDPYDGYVVPTQGSIQPEGSSNTQQSNEPANVEDDVTEIIEEEKIVDPSIEFSNMNGPQAKAKAYIYGTLKRRKKILLCEKICSFWAALVGWHFLIYNNERDSRPSQVLPIKECRCRPVATPQNVAKNLSKSTFEIFYKDDKCFQFMASSPEEMEKWVVLVRKSQANAENKKKIITNKKEPSKPAPNIADSIESVTTTSEEYDDVVIVNIGLASANTVAINPELNRSTSSGNQKLTALTKTGDEEAVKGAAQLSLSACFSEPNKKKNAPPRPPSMMKPTRNKDNKNSCKPSGAKVYKNGDGIAQIHYSNSTTTLNESTEEVYDDVAIAGRKLKPTAVTDKNYVPIKTKNIPEQESFEDDVAYVNHQTINDMYSNPNIVGDDDDDADEDHDDEAPLYDDVGAVQKFEKNIPIEIRSQEGKKADNLVTKILHKKVYGSSLPNIMNYRENRPVHSFEIHQNDNNHGTENFEDYSEAREETETEVDDFEPIYENVMIGGGTNRDNITKMLS